MNAHVLATGGVDCGAAARSPLLLLMLFSTAALGQSPLLTSISTAGSSRLCTATPLTISAFGRSTSTGRATVQTGIGTTGYSRCSQPLFLRRRGWEQGDLGSGGVAVSLAQELEQLWSRVILHGDSQKKTLQSEGIEADL